MNDMEYDTNRNFIFNEGHNIDPYGVDVKRVICQKTKFWSKDYEILELEKAYYEYIENNIFSKPALYFALHIFESLLSNFIKRKEFISKRINGLTKEANDLNNNLTPAVIYQPKSKKIIDDSIDDEKSQENEYFSKNERFQQDFQNNKMSEDYSNYYFEEQTNHRRLRTRASLNNGHNNIDASKKKKNIEWNETCYICNDFGELICCEECPNVVHLFCAFLNVRNF